MEQNISAKQWNIINEIVSGIYSDTPWPDLSKVIRRMKELVSFSHSISCRISDCDNKVEFFDHASDDIAPEHMVLYNQKYIYYDFILWCCASPKELTLRETDVLNENYMAESVFMKGWMEPINAYYGAIMNIAGNGHCYGNIALYRSKEEGNFSDLDILIMRTVNGHLCNCYSRLVPHGIRTNNLPNKTNSFSSKYALSPRETELVQEIFAGTLRSDLAAKLFISENTVKKHLNNIYRKTGAKNIEGLMNLLNPSLPKV